MKPPTHPTVEISQAHWDALADALGESPTEALYGPRPEAVNTADAVRTLYTAPPLFAGKAPRRALVIVVGLALVLAGSVTYRATHKRAVAPTEIHPRPTAEANRGEAEIHPCALVQTREEVTCR